MHPFQVPLTIGVTGHRQIAGDCTAKIEAAVHSILDDVRTKAPEAPLLLLTGLAPNPSPMPRLYSLGW